METSTMIRQLRRTAKKHENDKLHTFDTDISLMCTDVANRLEELEKEKQEIRNKAIDEFAERMKEKLKDMQFAEFQGIDVCPSAKTGEECPYINQDIGCQYCAREQTIKDIDEIAEQLKGGAV